MEVFSTPHIIAIAKRMSLRVDHAFDVKLGCDLRFPSYGNMLWMLSNKRNLKHWLRVPHAVPFRFFNG